MQTLLFSSNIQPNLDNQGMDNAKQHWKILQELGNDLANRVRSFLVIGKDGDGVIVVTEDGDGFWLGKIKNGWGKKKSATQPTPLDVPGLVEMAQSGSHILLLNKQGEIYSMGRNGHGQQGIGNGKRETHLLPQLISIPHKFISVRCGTEHCLALTEDGKVWAWGGNRYGQVGVPSTTPSLSSPRQIPELNPHRVTAVECGGRNSLALTDQGEVYAWGWNKWRQGDDVSLAFPHTPTQISTPSLVQSMAAGYFHTLLLTRTGEVYACGMNDCCQLGVQTDDVLSSGLFKVAGLPSISQIASHPYINLSIAMSTDKRCFVWGLMADLLTIISTPKELPPIYLTVESPLSSFSNYRNTPHSVQVPETPPNLFTRMSRMFDNPEFSDVQFVVEQRTIHAHRIILNNSSDYFAQMFSERWLAPVDAEDPIVRVTITDYSYQVFHVFLRFLYSDCDEVHSDLLLELFELASQYHVPDLQQLCLSRMRATLTPATCCLYYQFTLRHSLPELEAFQQELVQFISTNFLEVINSVAYQSMDAKLCKKLTLSMATHSL